MPITFLLSISITGDPELPSLPNISAKTTVLPSTLLTLAIEPLVNDILLNDSPPNGYPAILNSNGSLGETRTHMESLPQVFETCAYTNSGTRQAREL